MTLGLADAERFAAAIGPLRLTRVRARLRRHSGSHPRRDAGTGNEFWQYRTLEPGEAVDNVDWRRSARSDELYAREREREDPVRLWLWVDGTESMHFASDAGVPAKADAARTIAAAIGIAAHEAGESCCVPPSPRARAPVTLWGALGGDTEPPALPAPGTADIIVAAGDFLDAGSLDWAEEAAASGASGIIVAVADPAEIAFPFAGRVRFDGVEAGEAARDVGRAEDLAATYAHAWSAHRARLAAFCRTTGWLLAEVSTATPLDPHVGRMADWLRGAD